MSTYAYTNLVTPVNTGSGISEYVLLAPVTDFAVNGIKCPAAPFTNVGDQITISVPHEFKAGRAFARVALAPEKNELMAKTIGDTMFQKLDFEMKLFFPGSYKELHEAVANYINQPLIALVKDSNCPANMWYQLGCDCTAAYLKGDFSTGTTKNGVKGYEVTITWQNPYVQLYDVVGGPEELA
jgi:hypothetical protein